MMKGIRFDNVHSYTDLNLVLSEVDIPPAIPKMTFIDIPGGDGSVDLTEALGEVKYKDRECSFTFTVFPYEDFEVKKRQVSNLLNGKRCKIIVDKDPDYYWIGRCSVDEYASDKNLHQIVVVATVAPYKWKHDQTRVFIPFSGRNIFDPTVLPLIGGSGCDIATIDTGIRATWRSGTTSYMVVRFLPIEMVMGKTITFSTVITTSGGAEAMLRMGYTTANGSGRVAKASLIQTDKKTFTVGSDASGFEYLAVWFYANDGATDIQAGDYVDYTNLQIEIGDTATKYEAYTATTDPKEVILTCGRKSVCPTIICTGDVTLTVDGNDFELGKGTHKILDFRLHEGDNPVTVSGTGAVAFIYQEGDL